MRGLVLDGRFHGNDDIECLRAGITLRLGHNEVSAGVNDDHCVLGHDVELNILGST